MRDVKGEEIPTDEVCEKCGSKMVIKWGKFGRFMACSGYPDCKNTREIPKVCSLNGDAAGDESGRHAVRKVRPAHGAEARPFRRVHGLLRISGMPQHEEDREIGRIRSRSRRTMPLDEQCPACGKNLAIKHGRFGEYTACSDYPNCKYIKLKTTGVPARRCGGDIVERRSRRGKTFYGCSRYPDCDFVLWNKPLPEPCPECEAAFTLIKTTKRTGTIRFCDNLQVQGIPAGNRLTPAGSTPVPAVSRRTSRSGAQVGASLRTPGVASRI